MKQNKQIKNVSKKLIATLVSLSVILGATGMGLYHLSNPIINEVSLPAEIIEIEKIVNHTVEVPVNVTVEKIVNRTVNVEVENENMEVLLDVLYDNDGNIEYALEDLDDDELYKIVDRLVLIEKLKSEGVDYIKDEFADALDREVYTFGNDTVKFDEDDIERLRIDDDSDEIIITDSDFEDNDFDLEFVTNFEQDDIKYSATVTIEVKDSDVDDISIDSVSLR
jgi:hypothetical protein